MSAQNRHALDQQQQRRLRPEMVSLRLQVLDFVHDYICAWRASPSLGEIAAAVNASRVRVLRAVDNLAASGLLLKQPGRRGLALPTQRDEAMRLLKGLGMRIEAPQIAQGQGGVVTNRQLLAMPPIDYIPTSDGRDDNGQQKQTQAARKSARARNARTGDAAASR
jgi:DNA-binding transcriptional MocR family regulator